MPGFSNRSRSGKGTLTTIRSRGVERVALTLIACTVCLACSRGAVHPSAPADGVARVVPAGGTPGLSAADVPRSISARVATHVHEFGGAYIDGHGSLTVYLTNLSSE